MEIRDRNPVQMPLVLVFNATTILHVLRTGCVLSASLDLSLTSCSGLAAAQTAPARSAAAIQANAAAVANSKSKARLDTYPTINVTGIP